MIVEAVKGTPEGEGVLGTVSGSLREETDLGEDHICYRRNDSHETPETIKRRTRHEILPPFLFRPAYCLLPALGVATSLQQHACFNATALLLVLQHADQDHDGFCPRGGAGRLKPVIGAAFDDS